jgi:hypothetical protein
MDELRRSGRALLRSPAAEGGVIELVFAGKGCGGHSAAGKGGQQLSAPGRIGSFGSRQQIGFHHPCLPHGSHG